MKENVNKKRKIYDHSEELKSLLPAYDESDHESIFIPLVADQHRDHHRFLLFDSL